MRRLLAGRSCANRHEALRTLLGDLDDLASHPVLLVASSRAAAQEFLRGGCTSLATGVHRLGLWGLILDLATPSLAQEGRMPMSPLAEAALAARVLATKQAQLRYLTPVLTAPRIPSSLARTLDDLRRAGVSDDELRSLGPLGEDLAELAKGHRDLLDQRLLADATLIMAHAAKPMIQRYENWPLYLLDVLPKDPAEARVLSNLVQCAASVVATTPVDHPHLSLLQSALGVDAELISEPEPKTRLELVQTYIFRDSFTFKQPQDTNDDSIVFFSAPGEAPETVNIARHILRTAEQGTPFDRMAVFLRDPKRYQRHLEDAFTRAEIPVFFTRTSRRPDPTGRALLALLACADEGLSAERFAEYLSFGEVPHPDPRTGAPPTKKVPWVEARNPQQLTFVSLETNREDPAPQERLTEQPTEQPVIDGRLAAPERWELLLVEASVVGGFDRWARRLGGLEAELQNKQRILEAEHPHQAAKIRKDLGALHHLRRFALPLIKQLAELPTSATWRTWVDVLEKLSTQALRTPERVLRALAELRGLDSIAGVDLDEVQRVLRDRLAYLQDAPEEDQPYGRVWVGHIDEATGRSFETVYLPGLAEGMFPRSGYEDPLLHDGLRSQLAPHLVRRSIASREERARLHQALGAAEQTLIVSYPRIDQEKGRPRVPSFYAIDILRAADGRLPSLDELESSAQSEATTRVGWPAPEDPQQAIDIAEYDLAILAEQLRVDDTPEQGSGRYLVANGASDKTSKTSLNPHLVRSLYARAARWRSSFGPHDGWVRAPNGSLPVDPLLKGQRLTERAFSASALQHYAACPYRFYLSAILRLRPREKLIRLEQMDPLVRGNLAHAVLFTWFELIKKANLVPWTKDTIPLLMKHLAQAVATVSQDYREQLAPAIETVWDREVEELHRDLRTYLQQETQDLSGFFPAHAELAFGLRPESTERDVHSSSEPITLAPGFKIRGAIDLVEYNDDGRLRITDYKTGRLPSAQESQGIAGGQTLQPTMYAEAAAKLLNAEVESSRLAFCTNRGRFRSIYYQVGPSGQAALYQALQTIDTAVTDEFLPAAPKPGACTHCDYRAVCGTTEEERITRKDPTPLSQLRALRETR